MRNFFLNILPYSLLCLLTIIITMIFWPVGQLGWVQFTNSWIAFLFFCFFCVIFLFQEEIVSFLNQNIKPSFLKSTASLQKNKTIPEILKDEQKFQEIISGTVLAWMDKINFEKQEKMLREEDVTQIIERLKREKRENIKWLFLFANYYLAQSSKEMLNEIYEKHYVSQKTFQEIATKQLIDEKESETILDTLMFLKFIRKQDEEYIITETGSAFCTLLERINQK